MGGLMATFLFYMLAKFVLFWTMYTSSFYGVDRRISGVVAIDNTTVSTYLYPYQYVEWEIIASKSVYTTDASITSGIYYLRHNDKVHSILIITPKRIEQVVLAPSIGYKDRIIYKRNPRKLDKKL